MALPLNYSYFFDKDSWKFSGGKKSAIKPIEVLCFYWYSPSNSVILVLAKAQKASRSGTWVHTSVVFWPALKDPFPFLALLCSPFLHLSYVAVLNLSWTVLNFSHNFPCWSVPFILAVLLLTLDILNWYMTSCPISCCSSLLFSSYDCCSTTSFLFI